MTLSIVATSCGAALGALLRWCMGKKLNSLFPSIPPGALTVNLVGGYLVGVAVAYFSSHPSLQPEWRLLIVTGFPGGLTTFSTFSAEAVAQWMARRMMWGLSGIAVYLARSIAMTLLGIGAVVVPLRNSELAGG